mgnify:CR=1 FL=1|jgi:hypothetical protein
MTSKIKVDNINKVSDDSNIIKKCGTTTTIGSGASNPIVVDGSAVTLGRCGGTVALASGATQSGFGRTGTVDWITTKKTSDFTAANGEGYFVDTGSGAVTVTLPGSPSGGNIVSVSDYNGTAGTNTITIARNGSNINGDASNFLINKEDSAITFVYVDATVGWTSVQTSNTEDVSRIITPYIIATGGTITTSGDDKIHTFTGPGTFCITNEGTGANAIVSHMVIAGGGGGAHDDGGGGGAGGYRENESPATPYTASPLKGGTAVTATLGAFPITVGAGGAGGNPGSVCVTAGSNSIYSTITSAGGGLGGRSIPSGGPGGSGGGGDANSKPGGTGNTPPVSPPQGQNGGIGGTGNAAGGGGGAGAVGGNGSGAAPTGTGGNGGAGTPSQITGSPGTRAGGGGGGAYGGGGSGGPGGGGNGATFPSSFATAGAANTGGGGGGGATSPGPRAGKNGGSGVIVIRYKYQN